MINPDILRKIQVYADEQRAAGAAVIINYDLPSIAVLLASGEAISYKGEEATDLIDQIERLDPHMDQEDVILWMLRE